ncbi:unnamed protein product [Allacma fusca]|uniref:Uncharacterized protein n=1 Tax=Allacma fusca TaxID=39272 RepID=A0A8J2PGD2_9HEXA|nr:unnamed protein product [Allacma fusca]
MNFGEYGSSVQRVGGVLGGTSDPDIDENIEPRKAVFNFYVDDDDASKLDLPSALAVGPFFPMGTPSSTRETNTSGLLSERSNFPQGYQAGNENDRGLAEYIGGILGRANASADSAGSVFQAAVAKGAAAPYLVTAETGNAVAKTFGKGKITEKKGPIDELFTIVPDIIGTVGAAVIDKVGDSTGTHALLKPVVSAAGKGVGLGVETYYPPLLSYKIAAKGGYDAIKTAVVSTGNDGLLGLQPKGGDQVDHHAP